MNTEILHKQVWGRFIRMPYGHLIDYADKNGHTVFPTGEQLQAGHPNAFAWGLPIENGAFFTGLYLYSLCEKYDFAPDETLKNEIKILANGLLILCDVCKHDGCIARGVADDGVSHPPLSSEDQAGPWLLGLWRLMHSPASDEEMRADIKKRLIRTLSGIRNAGWRVSSEWEGVTGGNFSGKDWRGTSKLVFAAAAAKELGIIDDAEFERLVNERPDGGLYNRPEILSNGFAPDMIRETVLIQFWIDICAQLCVRELCNMDVKRAEYYRKGLAANAAVTVNFFREYEKYIDAERKPLCYDWRKLLEDIHPWNNVGEAYTEALRQLNIFFHQMSPGMSNEKSMLGQAMFACWIAVVGGDKASADLAYECLADASERVNWAECGYCFAFAAESAIYCYQKSNRK